jgi:hypothetical protein
LEKSFINDISKEDLSTANQIMIRCATKFQNILDKYSEPKKYSEMAARQLKSSKALCSLFLFPQLLNLDTSNLYSPSELKKMISNDRQIGSTPNDNEDIITVNGLADEIVSNKYITDSTLSKVYKKFKREGLLIHINSKRQLKNFRDKKTKKHKNIYKTRGRISFYTISPDVEEVRKVLSNPKAVEIINNGLKESGLLYECMEFIFKAFFYLMRRNASEEETEVLKKAVGTLFPKVYPNLELDMKYWRSFKESLSSQDEKLFEKEAIKIVAILEEKLGFPYLVYALS